MSMGALVGGAGARECPPPYVEDVDDGTGPLERGGLGCIYCPNTH
jgi:hypothetical protein